MNMRRLPLLTLLLIFATALPSMAQDHSVDFNPAGISFAQGRSWTHTLFGQRPITVAPINLANSSRLQGLLRGGKLYLSLNDAIALALENNLDIAIERFNLPIADTGILQAKSGASPGGVSTGISSGTPGGGAGGGGGAVAVVGGGGPAVPNFDPTLSTNFSMADNVQPPGHSTLGSSSFGTTAPLQSHNTLADFSFNKGFVTGGTVSLGYSNTRSSSSAFAPQVSSGISFSFSQPLLQGFGIELNTRNQVTAKDDRELADIAFSQQVMSTVAQIEDLYWNAVTANQAVRNAQESVDYAQTTLNNTQRQVEVGTMAPLQTTQAKATLATSQQALIAAQNTLEYDALLLKNAVTKNMADPTLADADVVTTDSLNVVPNEPILPASDLVKLALQYRPELAETRINMSISKMNIKASKDLLKPTLNLIGGYNANSVQPTYGSTFGDVFAGNFPSYSVGFNLQIPLTNHSGQASVARAQLQMQQAHLQQQQQINNIVISVEQARFTLESSRAQVLAAGQAVTFNRETVDADQKRLELGATTLTQVLLDQSNLTAANANLVTAESTYAQAKVSLEQLTGRTLAANRISILDAENGKVTQMPQANF